MVTGCVLLGPVGIEQNDAFFVLPFFKFLQEGNDRGDPDPGNQENDPFFAALQGEIPGRTEKGGCITLLKRSTALFKTALENDSA